MKHANTGKKPRFSKEFIEASIAAAPEKVEYGDIAPWTDKQFKSAIKSNSLEELREKLAERRRKRGERGPQKTPSKQSVTLRLDRDILARLKASGEGWQTRLNSLLRAAMDALK